MKKQLFKTETNIGLLFILGAIGVLIPYTILSFVFEYPDILRQDTSVILTKFYQGGSQLIWSWFAFAIVGIPLIPAYIILGKKLENRSSLIRVASTLGVTGLIVQMIGLLRWTFVVPMLADTYVHASDDATRSAAIIAFKTIHQFGGVLLGEHLGQLFTILWTILVSIEFTRFKIVPMWMNLLGIVSAIIYLFAQAELLSTVLPSIPVWDMAGFIGSTLWLIWLVVIGIQFMRNKTIL